MEAPAGWPQQEAAARVVGDDRPVLSGGEFMNGSTREPVTRSTGNQSVNATDMEAVVTDQRELNRFETTLSHNESWLYPHTFEPTYTGENIRVLWLLFPGSEVPEDPSMDDTEYSVHLWVDVTESDAE